MSSFERLFNRNSYSEMRRRFIRFLLYPYLRATHVALKCTGQLSKEGVYRIIVCRPNHRLGNLLLLTPLIVELERAFPSAKVDIVLAGPVGSELFRTFNNVGYVYCLSRRMIRHPIAVVRTILRIRRRCYDLAVDPCEASQSGRFLLALANATQAVGMPVGSARAQPDWRDVALRAPAHAAKWPVFIVRNAISRQLADMRLDYPHLNLRLSNVERLRARHVLSELTRTEGRSFIVGIFADATGAKRQAQNWWLRFIDRLLAQHSGLAIVEIVPPKANSLLSTKYPCFSSSNPREVAALISNMDCFVSADCGVMHLASASGTPTIGLFSVTDPSKYEPYGNHSFALMTTDKSPEEIASLASTFVQAITARSHSSIHETLDRFAIET